MSLAGCSAPVADARTGPVALAPERNRLGGRPRLLGLRWCDKAVRWVLMAPLHLRGRVSHLGTICWPDLV